MSKDKKTLPIRISLLVSAIILGVSLLGECALSPILILLAVSFVMLAVYWIAMLFVEKLKKWMLPITSAALVYLGVNIMILSRFKALLNEITWDPSMLGLGVAAIAFGFALFSQITLQRIEKTVQEIVAQPEDTVDLPTEPAAKAKLLEQLIIAPKPAEAKAVVDITGRVTVTSRSKEAAQKRLDEDTKKVGYKRGEIYQLEDGSWGIHWGGKYPL